MRDALCGGIGGARGLEGDGDEGLAEDVEEDLRGEGAVFIEDLAGGIDECQVARGRTRLCAHFTTSHCERHFFIWSITSYGIKEGIYVVRLP